MPYQLREARNAASESVWLTLNSERVRLNQFGFAGKLLLPVFGFPLAFYYIFAVGNFEDSNVPRHDLTVHPADLLGEGVGACPRSLRVDSAVNLLLVEDYRAHAPQMRRVLKLLCREKNQRCFDRLPSFSSSRPLAIGTSLRRLDDLRNRLKILDVLRQHLFLVLINRDITPPT